MDTAGDETTDKRTWSAGPAEESTEMSVIGGQPGDSSISPMNPAPAPAPAPAPVALETPEIKVYMYRWINLFIFSILTILQSK